MQLNNQDKIYSMLEEYQQQLLNPIRNSFLNFKLPKKDTKKPSKILLEEFNVSGDDINSLFKTNTEILNKNLPLTKNQKEIKLNFTRPNLLSDKTDFKVNNKKTLEEEIYFKKTKFKSVCDKAIAKHKDKGLHSLFLLGKFVAIDLTISGKSKTFLIPLQCVEVESDSNYSAIIFDESNFLEDTHNEQAKLFFNKNGIDFEYTDLKKSGTIVKKDIRGNGTSISLQFKKEYTSLRDYEKDIPDFIENSFSVIHAFIVVAEINNSPILSDYMNNGSDYANTPLVQAFLGLVKLHSFTSVPKSNVCNEKENYSILASDSSQREIINQTLLNNTSNQSIINVQGPPGSGKSQSILNLISTIYAKNKTILVVAEKKVALDVLKDRLKNMGLEFKALEIKNISEVKQKIEFYSTIYNNINLEKTKEKYSIDSKDYSLNLQKDLDSYYSYLWQPFNSQEDFFNNDVISTIYSYPDNFNIETKSYKKNLLILSHFNINILFNKLNNLFIRDNRLAGFSFFDNPWRDKKDATYDNLLKITIDIENQEIKTKEEILELNNNIDVQETNTKQEILELNNSITVQEDNTNQETLELNNIIALQETNTKQEILDVNNKINLVSKDIYVNSDELAIIKVACDNKKVLKTDSYIAKVNEWQIIIPWYRKLFLKKSFIVGKLLIKKQELTEVLNNLYFKLETLNIIKQKLDELDDSKLETLNTINQKLGDLANSKNKFVLLSNKNVDYDSLKNALNEDVFNKIDIITLRKNELKRDFSFVYDISDNELDELISDSIVNGIPFLKNVKSYIFSIHKNNILLNLNKFDSIRINDKRKEVLNLEKSILEKNTNNFLNKNNIKLNNNGNYSDFFKVVTRETNKVKSHLSPVKFIKTYQNELIETMPIWLTTITSVSQVLKEQKEIFDYIIFDEASQIKFPHAIPSLAKCKNSVYVFGDKEQMPPSNFFSSNDNEDDTDENDDDSLLEHAGKSLLDMAIEKNTHSFMLNWHYRSEKDALIHFSNLAFYGGNLKIIPNPFKIFDEDAFEFYIVDKAYAEKGKNEIEAIKVLSLLKENLTKYPNKSIGVITFGSAQSGLIEDLCDKEVETNSNFANLYNNFKNKEEYLFVKNLENVQGDERDIIILSVTYGKKEDGSIYLNFGPLNKTQGKNRLNVAVSRAKFKMIIVCSFDPTTINIEEDKELYYTKLYLDYTKSIADKNELLYTDVSNKLKILSDKIGQKGFWSTREPSKWVREIKERLEELGHVVHFEINPALKEISRYSIDLAVENPNQAGHFILGIECDGTYFHQNPIVKDRDINRENLLKQKGWNIERISSEEWGNKIKQDEVINRLDLAIKSLL